MTSLLNPIMNLIPRWHAATVEVGRHSAAGYQAAKDAVHAPDTAHRVDSLITSVDSFDHAITDSQKLPLLPRVTGQYVASYEAGKRALTVLLAAGVIPNARTRVGSDFMKIAQGHLHAGVDTYTDKGGARYGRYMATDLLDHTLQDGARGLLMLRRPDLALPMLHDLKSVSGSMSDHKQVDPKTIKHLDELFSRATRDAQTTDAVQDPLTDHELFDPISPSELLSDLTQRPATPQ